MQGGNAVARQAPAKALLIGLCPRMPGPTQPAASARKQAQIANERRGGDERRGGEKSGDMGVGIGGQSSAQQARAASHTAKRSGSQAKIRCKLVAEAPWRVQLAAYHKGLHSSI